MKAAAMAMGILLVFAGCQRPFAPGPPETIIYLKALDVVDITPEGNRPVTLEKTLLTETVTRQLVQAGLTLQPRNSLGRSDGMSSSHPGKNRGCVSLVRYGRFDSTSQSCMAFRAKRGSQRP